MVNCMAQVEEYFRLRTGNLNSLPSNDTICIQFRYKNAEIMTEQPSFFSTKTTIEDWDDEWNGYAKRAEKDFISSFNKRSRTLVLSTNSSDNTWQMRVHIRLVGINSYQDSDILKSLLEENTAESSVSLTGTITLFDEIKQKMCELSFSDIEGEESESIHRAFRTVYSILGKMLGSYINELKTEEAETL